MPAESDVIGPWSGVKLDILREYAAPYSRIVAANGFRHLYIDAFAASGAHISRETRERVLGSPMVALSVEPPFAEYHFIDSDPERIEHLKKNVEGRERVYLYAGDANDVLPREIFPRARYQDRKRGLCLLDPYNINLSWEVVAAAGQMKSIEVFVNFMVMDMNMNVLLRDPNKADPRQMARMDRFWGGRSWRDVAYEESPQQLLFGETEEVKVEGANQKIAEAYGRRLVETAGFGYVPEPLRFVNSLGRTIYYLFFASPNETGKKIVESIFSKYRKKQGL